MKKTFVLFVVILVLALQGSVMGQEMLVRPDDQSSQGQTGLPQLQNGIPDPGPVYGGVGSLYQEKFPYFDKLYDTYLPGLRMLRHLLQPIQRQPGMPVTSHLRTLLMGTMCCGSALSGMTAQWLCCFMIIRAI